MSFLLFTTRNRASTFLTRSIRHSILVNPKSPFATHNATLATLNQYRTPVVHKTAQLVTPEDIRHAKLALDELKDPAMVAGIAQGVPLPEELQFGQVPWNSVEVGLAVSQETMWTLRHALDSYANLHFTAVAREGRYGIRLRPSQASNHLRGRWQRRETFITLGHRDGIEDGFMSMPENFRRQLGLRAEWNEKWGTGSESAGEAPPQPPCPWGVLLIVDVTEPRELSKDDWTGAAATSKKSKKSLANITPRIRYYSANGQCPYVFLSDYTENLLLHVTEPAEEVSSGEPGSDTQAVVR